ncbi:dynein heavy chain 3, axonemal-like [Folsomia candida]|nr:dynein heavy chain 3, axonemal-like [Folsomia candida]
MGDDQRETMPRRDEELLVTRKRSKLKPHPPIPRLPKSVEEKFSSGFEGLEYPPILQTNSWMRSAPFKEEYTDLSPSENIGNHYSPPEARFKLKELAAPPRKNKKTKIVIDLKELKAPPPTLERKYLTTQPNSHSIMPLVDLLSGAYKKNDPKPVKELLPVNNKRKSIAASDVGGGNGVKNKKLYGCVDEKPQTPVKEEIHKQTPSGRMCRPRHIEAKESQEEGLMNVPMDRLFDLISKRTAYIEPLWPEQQLFLMKIVEDLAHTPDPTEVDLARYKYYIQSISDDDVADWPPNTSSKIRKLLPKSCTEKRVLKVLVERLEERARSWFKWALKKAIVDYILMDPAERVRIKVFQVEQSYQPRIVRGPIPWHNNYVTCREVMRNTLFLCHPILVRLRKLWDDKYRDQPFLNIEQFLEPLPLPPMQLATHLKILIANGRSLLTREWARDVANLFVEMKETWVHLVPQRKSSSLAGLIKLFGSVAALMSRQMRDMVMSTLENVNDIFETYAQGNSFEGEYSERLFNTRPILSVTVLATNSSPFVAFKPQVDEVTWKEPSLRDRMDCINTVTQLLAQIIAGGKLIPRIEKMLFPELYPQDINLLPVVLHETGVKNIFSRISNIIRLNLTGPKQYIHFYDSYFWLIDGTADAQLQTFLDREPNYKYMAQKIEELTRIKTKVYSFRKLVPLNFLALDCSGFNQHLIDKLNSLIDRVVLGEVEKNERLLQT